jgi:hypothetical protein
VRGHKKTQEIGLVVRKRGCPEEPVQLAVQRSGVKRQTVSILSGLLELGLGTATSEGKRFRPSNLSHMQLNDARLDNIQSMSSLRYRREQVLCLVRSRKL